MPVPPRAPQRPFTRLVHGDAVEDPYHWMADKTDPAFTTHLEAENAYADALTAHLSDLREELYEDISARTKQTDLSVPLHVAHSDGTAYWYYSRTVEGLDYPLSCRLPATSRDAIPDVTEPHPDEVVILDGNALAQGHDFSALGWSEVSPDGRRLAYAVDHTGDERYDLVVLDLATGAVLDDTVTGIGAGGAWAGDDWIFHTRVDAAWRPHEVWRHRIGCLDDDALVLAEPDAMFWLGVGSSRDDAWVLVEAASRTTSETHLVPAADPTASPRCVAPRRPGVEYAVEVGPDALWILHNHDAPQFSLARVPLATPDAPWETVLAHDPDTRLVDVAVYDAALVVSHRTAGLPGIRVCDRLPGGLLGPARELEFDEPLYDVGAEDAPDADTDRIRFGYESLTSPPSVWEYHFATGERRLLKESEVRDHPVHGPYDRTRYVAERLWATAEDGIAVPISLVRHVDTPVNGTAPGLLTGYGSYEIPNDPHFATSRISLLDRGFVVAIAHVRGGGELGRPWYEGGKELAKTTTFTDFVACARLLVDAGHVAPDRLAIEGGSAGGLLIGAAVNLAPDLFRAAHAIVPFVDPLTTILNPELPLTVMEWEEWGDPLHDPQVYTYMKDYSPYENVDAGPYPAILASTSYHDTRVEVTEPAKWVARLRDRATNPPERPILLRTEMAGGHGGVSGRYKAWRERAWQLAWLIDQVGRGASAPQVTRAG
nr:S9 family peptidase [Propioniciclava soli]